MPADCCLLRPWLWRHILCFRQMAAWNGPWRQACLEARLWRFFIARSQAGAWDLQRLFRRYSAQQFPQLLEFFRMAFRIRSSLLDFSSQVLGYGWFLVPNMTARRRGSD